MRWLIRAVFAGALALASPAMAESYCEGVTVPDGMVPSSALQPGDNLSKIYFWAKANDLLLPETPDFDSFDAATHCTMLPELSFEEWRNFATYGFKAGQSYPVALNEAAVDAYFVEQRHRGELDAKDQQIAALQSVNRDLQRQLAAAGNRADVASGDSANFAEQLAAETARANAAESLVAGLRGQISALRAQLGDLGETAAAQIADLQGTLRGQFDAQAKGAYNLSQSVVAQLQAAGKEITHLTEQLGTANATISARDATIAADARTISGLRGQNDSLTTDNGTLGDNLEAANTILTNQKTTIDSLNVTLDNHLFWLKVAFGILLLALCFYFVVYLKRKFLEPGWLGQNVRGVPT